MKKEKIEDMQEVRLDLSSVDLTEYLWSEIDNLFDIRLFLKDGLKSLIY